MGATETIDYKGYRIEIIRDEDPMDPVKEWDQLGTMVCFHNRYNLGHKHNWRNPDEMMRGLAIAADETVQDRIEYWENGNGWVQLRNKAGLQKYELGEKVFVASDAADLKIKELIQSTIDKHYITLPLYLYDHSGITMSTSPFSCPWDSGQVGIIYITKKKACEEYGWKRLNKARRDRVVQYLIGQVETYDQYLTGDVYGYRVLELDEDGDELDNISTFSLSHQSIFFPLAPKVPPAGVNVIQFIADSCWGYFGSEWKENGLMGEAKSAIDYHIAQKEKEAAEEVQLEREAEDFVRNHFAL